MGCGKRKRDMGKCGEKELGKGECENRKMERERIGK
jgi:hypothetical protein